MFDKEKLLLINHITLDHSLRYGAIRFASKLRQVERITLSISSPRFELLLLDVDVFGSIFFLLKL